jgi:hypothetical protein
MRIPELLLALALLGCGGSDASSAPTDATVTADSSSPDSRIDPNSKCYFTGDLIVDGVTRGVRGGGCGIGSVTNGVVQVGMSEMQGSERVQVTFYLDEPVTPGYTGPIRVDDIKVSIASSTSARKWIGTSCTLSITRNEPIGDAGVIGDSGAASWHFRAWGSGSCASPFTPDATMGTLSVGAFELMFEASRSN